MPQSNDHGAGEVVVDIRIVESGNTRVLRASSTV